MEERDKKTTWRRVTARVVWVSVAGILGILLLFSHFFGPVDKAAGTVNFVVAPGQSSIDIANKLEQEHLARSALAVQFSLLHVSDGKAIRPGGYELSASMDAGTLAETLSRPPYLVWITVPRGQRKEQIAGLLAENLSWSDTQKKEWLTVDTNPSPSLTEGVYFPTTYLIPYDQTPREIAERMRAKFSEVYNPLVASSSVQNAPWTTVVTLASMIEREAAGAHDMALISGIMWNRIEKGMPLGIDATLQYIKGTEENWWPVVHGEDKYLKSPFNTYFRAGLPPHPIANPSANALVAALNPEETSCLYYLHDYKGIIHCAKTYKQHVANVNKYLK